MTSRLIMLLSAGLLTMIAHSPPEACAAGYCAFSLRQAQSTLQTSGPGAAKARTLAGITRPVGCVFDEENKDVIIIGQVDPTLPALRLDDAIVAMRAVLKVREAPWVSIDPAPKGTNPSQQVVRFGGKVENTQFGKDLLNADIVLKKLGLGKLNADVWGVRSYFDLAVDKWHQSENEDAILSRFWFLADPDGSAVTTRSGVGLVKRLKIKVQTEVVASESQSSNSAPLPGDLVGSAFAENMTNALDDIMLAMPELRRLDQLYRLVGVASVLERWRDKFGLDTDALGLTYWLDKASIETVPTPQTYGRLSSTASGLRGKGLMTISGGIELRALAADVKGGSLAALCDLVVKSRPSKTALSWQVPVGDALDQITDAGIAGVSHSVQNGQSPGMHLLKSISNDASALSPVTERFQAAVSRASSIPLSQMGTSWRNEDLHVGGVPQSRIGGVMLKGAASVVGGAPSSVDASKLFTLIASGDNAVLSRAAHRRFVTALWSVYYSNEDPGISIDPIAWGADKQLVRYIGRVVNTDLGRVMRDADYLMKKWAVGTEKPDIPGFRDVDTIAGADGMTYADASRRFWFVPEGMTFKASDGVFLFDHGRITLKTELMLEGRQTHVVESDLEFARFFTDHYEQIAAKYPVYDELFEYAKLVSVAKYLKQQNVPLHWFLMAHLDDVITEDSIGAVDTLSKGSKFLKDVRIEGGVDMCGQYVLDETAAAAIQRAVSRLGQPRQVSSPSKQAKVLPESPQSSRTLEVEEQVFSVLPQHSSTCGTDMRGVRYQTDVAVRRGTEPGLELVRYFQPPVKGVYARGEFGNGWHLLRPYRIVPVGKPEVPFLNVLIPAKVAVRNLVTGEDEILSFDDKTYELDGYRPADMEQSRIIGLFWTVAGGMRLVDKLGNEFWFNEGLMLSEMHFSDEFGVQFEYDFEEAGREAFERMPYRLAREGKDVVDDMVMRDSGGGETKLPKKLKLTEAETGVTKVFTFGENASGLLGYAYDAPQPSDREFIALRNDGVHILLDANGNEVWFDEDLQFLKLRPLLVKAVVQGAYEWNDDVQDIDFVANHTARLKYEFQSGGFRVSTANVFKKGLSTAIHSVAYRYSQDSMLASASNR